MVRIHGRAARSAAVVALAAGIGLLIQPGTAGAVPVPSPNLCEVALAHALDMPGFNLDDTANSTLLAEPAVRALLAR